MLINAYMLTIGGTSPPHFFEKNSVCVKRLYQFHGRNACKSRAGGVNLDRHKGGKNIASGFSSNQLLW